MVFLIPVCLHGKLKSHKYSGIMLPVTAYTSILNFLPSQFMTLLCSTGEWNP